MVKTRQEAIAILDHLLTVVLDVPAGNTHPIRISFADHQVENMDDFDCSCPTPWPLYPTRRRVMIIPRKQYRFSWVIDVTSAIFSYIPN